MKLSATAKDNYLQLLKALGEDGLYKKCIGQALMQSANVKDPDVGLLDCADGFLILYRRTEDDAYIALNRILRRAAHVVNRELMRQNAKKKTDGRFLRAV